jgi:hypothetical protein
VRRGVDTDLFLPKVEISIRPGFWIRGYQRRRIVGQPQIGKPSEAKTLCNLPRDSFKTDFIIGSLDGVDEFLKRTFH